MNKQHILEQLINKVEEEKATIKKALEMSLSHVKDPDMKQESKYDTRSIEAGYLADGQRARLHELELELKLLNEIPNRKFSSQNEIAVGALVDIEFNKKIKTYFLSTTGGGTILDIQGQHLLVISVFSPIGAEILGLKSKDTFELQTPSEKRQYKIISVK
jgi:transcription elongation GreA/GreB family factor